jgi:hypothetical protein
MSDARSAHLSEADILAAMRTQTNGNRAARDLERTKTSLGKARRQDSVQALSKLAELVDGRCRIVSQPRS